MKKLLVSLLVTSALAVNALASAGNARTDALREGVQDVDARANVIRKRATRTRPAVRREVERVVMEIDRNRAMVEGRIAVLELVAPLERANERAMLEMENTLKLTQRLLYLVERWFGMH